MQQPIPAASGVGLRLQRGELLRITDPHGGQSGDLMAFSQDGQRRLSNGRTSVCAGALTAPATLRLHRRSGSTNESI